MNAEHKGTIRLTFHPTKSQQQEARNQRPEIKFGQTGFNS